MSFVVLVLKLVFSLFFYLVLFFLEKIFPNKFFLSTNIALTILVVGLFIFTIFTPSFDKPEDPQYLNFPSENNQIKIIKITSKEAFSILENFNKNDDNYSQRYNLNMANLSLVGKDKKIADYFLKTARYINPNSELIK